MKNTLHIHPKLIPVCVAIAAMLAMVILRAVDAPPELLTAVLWSANGMLEMWLLLSFTGRLK